jgi:hypothetical protein
MVKHADTYAFEFLIYQIIATPLSGFVAVFFIGQYFYLVMLYMVFIGTWLHPYLYGQGMTCR